MVDLMHASRNVPLVALERKMRLAALVTARAAAAPRPSWSAILTKAFALVAARRPELRRAYLPFPWPHLYEHPDSVAAVAVERRIGSEDGLLFALVPSPERLGLIELEACLRRCKEPPVEAVASFRTALAVSRLPGPLRRLAWWGGLNLSGDLRARCFGTFGVTTTAGFGGATLSVRSPLTCTLYYGLFDPAGCIDMRLALDHRVLDGGTASRALHDLEGVLLGEIQTELEQLDALDWAEQAFRGLRNGDRLTPGGPVLSA